MKIHPTLEALEVWSRPRQPWSGQLQRLAGPFSPWTIIVDREGGAATSRLLFALKITDIFLFTISRLYIRTNICDKIAFRHPFTKTQVGHLCFGFPFFKVNWCVGLRGAKNAK